MSNIEENAAGVSEDLFNTEDLIETPDEEAISENESPEFDQITEADEEMDEPEEPENNETEDLEKLLSLGAVDEEEMEADIVENSETNEVTETDGTKTKPVRKVNLNRLTELPLSKVKHIIKLDPDVNLVNAEAVFLVTKATEFFVRSLGKESFNFAVQQKKKTITKQHVDQALTMLPIEL